MGSVRVSVALCTYNSSRFLASQLASIAAQSRRVEELVVSDDGSTDDTWDIIEAASPQFASVIPMPRERAGGVTRNFARAIAGCSGEIIVLSDHDDVWHADKVAVLVDHLPAGAPAMVFGDARLINHHGETIPLTLFEAFRVSRNERDRVRNGRALDVLVRRNIVTGATAAFTTELAAKAQPFPDAWVHDEWLALVAALTGTLHLLEQPLTDYRQHGGNEIGASSPGPISRLRRMFASAPDRHQILADRFAIALQKARDVGADARDVALLERKVGFETARAALPKVRALRTPRIVRLLCAGDYRVLASQSNVDALRDLLVR